jgi:Na+:H+ antiporter, NhaA family
MRVPPRSRGQIEVRAERSYIASRVLLPAQAFIHTQAASGITLLAAAIVAVVWANSPWKDSYFDLWGTVLSLDVSLFSIEEDLRHWINEGLMVFFFFVVALEIKRELVRGELSEPKKAALPVAAAAGGLVVPAVIYLAFNIGGDGEKGWGIPMATDIAFAVGVLAMLGNRVPSEARLFLLALAIVDDVGAILVIAVFYTESLSLEALGIAGVLIIGLIAMNRLGVRSMNVYFGVGALIWVAIFQSGLEATLTGVILGALTPTEAYFSRRRFGDAVEALSRQFEQAAAKGNDDAVEMILGQFEEVTHGTEAPLERLERLLHPLTSFVVVPLFALANAGIDLSGGVVGDASSSPVTWGIVAGLLIGKPCGIFAATWLVVKSGVGSLPANTSWSHVLGLGLLAGIGFTVALFITGLAFEDLQMTANAKAGVLLASVLAGLAGYGFLRALPPQNEEAAAQSTLRSP